MDLNHGDRIHNPAPNPSANPAHTGREDRTRLFCLEGRCLCQSASPAQSETSESNRDDVLLPTQAAYRISPVPESERLDLNQRAPVSKTGEISQASLLPVIAGAGIEPR